MSNYRFAVIEEDTDWSTDKTSVMDINHNEVCSRYDFQIRYKNKASPHTGQDGHPHALLSKIEVIDGSDVLLSVSGKQLGAMNFYNRGNRSHNKNSCQTATTGHYTLSVDWGRILGDPLLAFDPNEFTNPQLKITHALSGLDADLQSLTFGWFAYLFDDKKVSPGGFIQRKEIKSWDGVASAVEYHTLPTDYPYRQMYLQGLASTKEIRTMIDSFELYEGERSKILIPEMEMYDWIQLVEGKWGKCSERIESDTVGGGKTFYTMPSYQKMVNMIAQYSGYVMVTTNEGDQTVLESSSAGSGSEQGWAWGTVPHHIVPAFLHDMQDPADWFVPATDKKLKLKTTAKSDATTGYTGAIILEQNRAY